jgi:hypothetical protein
MTLTPIIVIITVCLGFSTISGCLSIGEHPKNLFSSQHNSSGTA